MNATTKPNKLTAAEEFAVRHHLSEWPENDGLTFSEILDLVNPPTSKNDIPDPRVVIYWRYSNGSTEDVVASLVDMRDAINKIVSTESVRASEAIAFVDKVAGLDKDGDVDVNGAIELENDHAFETLCGLISQARDMTDADDPYEATPTAGLTP